MLYADPAQFDEAFLAALLPQLPPEQREKLRVVRHLRARRESVLAWGLLVYAFRQRFPRGRLPALLFGAHGKPFFENAPFHFNLSHTDALVCLALSDGGEIGVDAQMCTLPSDALVRKTLTAAEQNILAASGDKALCFTRFWTQKEALMKQTGEGLSRGFDSLDFAPFAGRDTFSAFGLCFATQPLGGAVVTQCAETPPDQISRAVSQRDLEQVLFSNSEGAWFP